MPLAATAAIASSGRIWQIKLKTETALWLLAAHPDSWELPADMPRSFVAEALPLGLIRPAERKGRWKLTEKGYASSWERLAAS